MIRRFVRLHICDGMQNDLNEKKCYAFLHTHCSPHICDGMQNDLNFARVQKYIQMMNTETQKVTKMPKKSRGRQKIQAFPSGLYATEAGRQLYEDQVRLLRGDHNTSEYHNTSEHAVRVHANSDYRSFNILCV